MRYAVLGGCLAWIGLLGAAGPDAAANEYVPAQLPNQPIGIRQEAPQPFPPLAQALHVEEVPGAVSGAKPGPEEQAQENSGEPLPLPKPSKKEAETVSLPSINLGGNQTASIAASLFVVIGLFMIFAWVGKKNMKPGSGRLSKEIVQVLGKSQLSGKQQLELVRVGQKLLLLCVTPNGADTLTEITDPAEVERLLALIRQDSPGSMTATFQDVLTQMGRQPTRGFLEA